MPDSFMRQAIELAMENVRSGRGGPFGAVISRDGAVLATGVNQVTTRHDPTAHAEIVAIRAACAALRSFELTGCDIYCTCEPCPMCLGAIYWARLSRVFFGATAADAAAAGFEDVLIYQQIGQPSDARKIPFLPLLRQESLACFRAWETQPGRVLY